MYTHGTQPGSYWQLTLLGVFHILVGYVSIEVSCYFPGARAVYNRQFNWIIFLLWIILSVNLHHWLKSAQTWMFPRITRNDCVMPLSLHEATVKTAAGLLSYRVWTVLFIGQLVGFSIGWHRAFKFVHMWNIDIYSFIITVTASVVTHVVINDLSIGVFDRQPYAMIAVYMFAHVIVMSFSSVWTWLLIGDDGNSTMIFGMMGTYGIQDPTINFIVAALTGWSIVLINLAHTRVIVKRRRHIKKEV
jgi:hypothetical protein